MLFVRFLLISILILYIIRSLFRMLVPMLFQSLFNKAQQHTQQQQRQYHNPRPPEAKIKVDYIPKDQKGTVPDSEGDFVDYEEIK